MPLLEYKCESCHHKTEKLAKLNNYPPYCENCGKVMVQIIWSTPSPAIWACSKGSL